MIANMYASTKQRRQVHATMALSTTARVKRPMPERYVYHDLCEQPRIVVQFRLCTCTHVHSLHSHLTSEHLFEFFMSQGGAKLVDHPLYQKPQLRTKMRSVIPRLLGLCCILVVVMMGCGYVMYSQLAAG